MLCSLRLSTAFRCVSNSKSQGIHEAQTRNFTTNNSRRPTNANGRLNSCPKFCEWSMMRASSQAKGTRVTRSHFSTSRENTKRILITGALGQIGTELSKLLRLTYGQDNVITSDIKKPPEGFREQGPYIYLNVLDPTELARVIVDYEIDWVIHNSSVLSATGEKDPQFAITLNNDGFRNILDVARTYRLRVFAPSSIAAFGPSTPSIMTPNTTIQDPVTIYGITKVYLELLGTYYWRKYGVDFRSLRYPGIISTETLPGGGTTDYAVEIFYEALKRGKYECFLKPDTELPMMYMPDCLLATKTILETEVDLPTRVYNVTGMSFTPRQLEAEIRKYIPNFEMTYRIDFRQAIADSWPKSLDDSLARQHWKWQPQYDLRDMTIDSLVKLRAKMQQQQPYQKLQTLQNI